MKRYLTNLLDIICLFCSCAIFTCLVSNATTVQIGEAAAQMLQTPLLVTWGVSLLLMLAFPRFTKMFWNVIFCLGSMFLFAEVMAWVTQGVVVPPPIREAASPIFIPSLWEAGLYYDMAGFLLLWGMSALCCLGFCRVIITSLGCYVVWLLLSFALYFAGEAWLASEGAPLAGSKALLENFPWITAAVSAIFVSLYGVLMSVYDACCTPWPDDKKDGDSNGPEEEHQPVEEKKPEPAEEKKPEPAEEKKPEPVEEKKPEPVEEKKPEPAEEKKPEPVEEKKPEPVEEKKPEPAEEKKPEPAEEKKPEPAEEKKPEPVEEKKPEPVEEKKPEPAEEKKPEPVEEKKPEPAEEKKPEPAEEKKPEPVEEKKPEPAEEKKPEPSTETK